MCKSNMDFFFGKSNFSRNIEINLSNIFFIVHIFFDDAYKDNGCVNEFITELNSVIDEATR